MSQSKVLTLIFFVFRKCLIRLLQLLLLVNTIGLICLLNLSKYFLTIRDILPWRNQVVGLMVQLILTFLGVKSQITDLARNFDPKFQITLEEVENVLVVNVPEGTNKPYSVGGKFYLRYGPNSQQLSRDEIREFFQKEGLVLWEEKTNKDFNFDNDFNQQAFEKFLKLANISPVADKEKLLQNQALMKDGLIRNVGILLFCKEIAKFFPNASIMCVLFRGTDKAKILDSREFREDLYSNYDNAFEYLNAKLNTEYIIKGGPREEKLELPEDALREAILNAIAHRDYFSPSNIQINIFKDRVEVVSPGGLVSGMAYSDLGKISMPRNILLFGLMQRMDLIEKAGTGIIRMKKAMETYLLPEPKIDVNKNWFSITFQRPDLQEMTIQERLEGGLKSGLKGGLKRWSEKNLSERQLKILEILTENPKISKNKLAQELSINPSAVQKHLETLKKLGLIKREGSVRGGYWRVKESF
ncbi:MAG: transcriptional regulator [Nanoarchaeota archaeon]|nr:transcriptional regulator [Nanoarchaeota archaeon]